MRLAHSTLSDATGHFARLCDGFSQLVKQPKLAFLPEGQRGGPKILGMNPRAGRKAAGNGGQGHFLDRARQLTSPALGRAILQEPACADF